MEESSWVGEAFLGVGVILPRQAGKGPEMMAAGFGVGHLCLLQSQHKPIISYSEVLLAPTTGSRRLQWPCLKAPGKHQMRP